MGRGRGCEGWVRRFIKRRALGGVFLARKGRAGFGGRAVLTIFRGLVTGGFRIERRRDGGEIGWDDGGNVLTQYYIIFRGESWDSNFEEGEPA